MGDKNTIVRDSSGKFMVGNKSGGRKQGLRDRLKRYEAIVGDDFDRIISKVVEMAIDGDIQAIKLIMDRMWAVPTSASSRIDESMEDLEDMLGALMSADDAVDLSLVPQIDS